MKQQTAVEWLVEQLPLSTTSNGEFIVMIPQSTYHTFVMKAKQMEKEQIIEEIIGFQIYLHDQGYITNHDWDFEKEAIYYLHKNQIK